MYLDFIPKDVANICTSYLSENEIIYMENNWNKFSKNDLCKIAVENGWLDLLEWGLLNGCKPNYLTDIYATKNGQLNILKWLYKNGYCIIDSILCELAIERGYFDILKWAFEIGSTKKIFCKENLCMYAARHGHFEMLKWLYDRGCQINEWTCASAAKGGYLEILIWLRENGCPWNE